MSPGHCTDHVRQNPPGSLGRRLCGAHSGGVCPHLHVGAAPLLLVGKCSPASAPVHRGGRAPPLPAASSSLIEQGGSRGSASLGTHLSVTGLGWEPGLLASSLCPVRAQLGSPCTLPKPQVAVPCLASGHTHSSWAAFRTEGANLWPESLAFLLVLFREQHASNYPSHSRQQKVCFLKLSASPL